MNAATTSTAARRATYQDVLDAPAHLVAEIIDGTLYTHPRPAPRHAVASTVLGGELGPPFHRGQGGPGGWWIIFEPELHLEEGILVPDLAGWRRERMPELPESAYFTLAPDWACEVLSASTRKLELGRGDPQLQTVTGERIAALEGIGETPRETPDKGEEAEPVGPGERPVGDGSSSKDHELTVPGRESGASMGLGLWGFAIHLRGSSRQATDGTRIPD